MGLGGTAKKIQKLGDRAEELYARVGELKEQLQELRNTVESTGEQVDGLEDRMARQEALVRAIATEHDVDVEAVLAEAVIDDAEGDAAVDATDGAGDANAANDAEADAAAAEDD